LFGWLNHPFKDQFYSHGVRAHAVPLEVTTGAIPLAVVISDLMVIVFAADFGGICGDSDALFFFFTAFCFSDLTA